MRISVSYVTLSVLCHRTPAHVITFLPVVLWRVTINTAQEKAEITIIVIIIIIIIIIILNDDDVDDHN